MTHLLLLHRPRATEVKHLVAWHMDPNWLKQRGYEIARSLGNHGALWQCTGECAPLQARFALDIDREARLTIERSNQSTLCGIVKKPAFRLAFSDATTATNPTLSGTESTLPASLPRQR